jgi:hypothetical protein
MLGRGDVEPLQGSIHLRVDEPANPRRRNLRLDQPGAVPLKAHDQFRIEAKLNRPASLYIFWVGSDGRVGPIYPWTEGDWGLLPTCQEKTDRLDLPRTADGVWEIPPGEPGLETLVLLAREESPLPRDVDLPKRLADTTARSPLTIAGAAWVENGREVSLDPRDRGSGLPTRKSDDPVLRIRRLLREKVQPLGDYTRAVIFPNRADER